MGFDSSGANADAPTDIGDTPAGSIHVSQQSRFWKELTLTVVQQVLRVGDVLSEHNSERLAPGDALDQDSGARLRAYEIESGESQTDRGDLSLWYCRIPTSPGKVGVLMDN